jgi:hypothetical protein
MPRTIESIVDNHQRASERRKAGLPSWDCTANIKAVIYEDRGNTSPEHIADLSVRIAKILRARLPARYFDISHPDFDFDFVDAVEFLEGCTVEGLAIDKEQGCTAAEMFNGWLDTVYDWADRNRVWLGP